MDLVAIFGGLSTWQQILISVASGAIFVKFLDELVLWGLSKFWPSKYIEIFYGWVRQLNSRIEDIKKQYPKSGKKLEDNIIEVMKNSVKIIEG